MDKIKLIIQREYITRVRKKSFIIMTLLAPLLMAALFVLPVWIMSLGDNNIKKIAIVDDSQQFQEKIADKTGLTFTYLRDGNIDKLKDNLEEEGYFAVLYIPDIQDITNGVTIYSEKQPSFDIKRHIARAIEKELERAELKKLGIKPEDLEQIKQNIDIQTVQLTEIGEKETSTELTTAIGFIMAFSIYMIVFIYGAQVMRGVIEEKTSRVVEVIISSVKPFQLMMGKIVGVALVVLTQMSVWIVLTTVIVSVVQPLLMDTPQATSPTVEMVDNPDLQDIQEIQKLQNIKENPVTKIFTAFTSLPLTSIVISFIIYFLGGFLLYSSLFAAVGSAVDNETDTQQFMLPISLPLILGIMVAQTIIQFPDGNIAFWFSIIPFTSPICMMVRIPFGVPLWQLILSVSLLIITFVGTTWLAAKIYRVGILMYGKKVNYKELWKWIRYSN